MIKLELVRDGDIEQNTGQLINFKHPTHNFGAKGKKLKFFNVNAQSLVKKRSALADIVNDLGRNTIHGVTATWLKNCDDTKLWEITEKHFKSFRVDRKPSCKDRDSGVMLIVPKILNLKPRYDLNILDNNHFESPWIECNVNNDTSLKRKPLINISYNLKQILHSLFIE